MIQLNLLPDVKMEYIKSERLKRVVISVSIIVSAIAVGILIILLSVDGLQKKHLNDLKHSINSQIGQLKQKPEISKVLTVQNQLENLTTLHNNKPDAVRVFDYLNNSTPSKVGINSFSVDFNQHQITITGTTGTLSDVNKYIDTLKYTTYTVTGNTTPNKAFSNVVLSNFGVSTSQKDGSQTTTFTISQNYDSNIFDITKNVTLSVPSQVTTRSQVDQPTDLFTGPPASKTTTSPPSGGTH